MIETIKASCARMCTPQSVASRTPNALPALFAGHHGRELPTEVALPLGAVAIGRSAPAVGERQRSGAGLAFEIPARLGRIGSSLAPAFVTRGTARWIIPR